MIIAKFSTIRGGVYIEQRNEENYQNDTRCFRFDNGTEYAFYGDLMSNNPNPRWYGHQYKITDFILT